MKIFRNGKVGKRFSFHGSHRINRRFDFRHLFFIRYAIRKSPLLRIMAFRFKLQECCFDLMGNYNSLTGYVIINGCVNNRAFITIGGLGFIVLNELVDYRKTQRLSLHSKVVLTMTCLLTVGGTILILLFEAGNPKIFSPFLQ